MTRSYFALIAPRAFLRRQTLCLIYIVFLILMTFGKAHTSSAQSPRHIQEQIQIQNQAPLIKPTLQPYKLNRVVEDVPQRMKTAPAFYTVPAHKTPSGFPVPRYVSLKVGKANGRIGPSINHPVAWQYRRRGLPLIVVAETKRWRKVRDVNGDESWIYSPALSGERRAIAVFDTPLRYRDKDTSRVKAVALKGALVKIEECRDTGWCKFKSANGLKGWAPQNQFWGASPLKTTR